MGKKLKLWFPSALIFVLTFSLIFCSNQKNDQITSHNNSFLAPSLPEEQGVDSGILLSMLEKIKNDNIQIRSIIVLRNQRVILEFYRYPYNREKTFNTKSASKSVISALVGIALREKWIDSLDRKVESFFPQLFTGNVDKQKKMITLRHLLSMTSGLKIQEQSPEWGKIFSSEDPVGITFGFPMAAEPGTTFNYLTPMPLVMSVILTQASGLKLEDICRDYLLKPLGITGAFWKPVHKKYAFTDLHMRPIDMARFGLLYLQKGNWNGQKILPEKWVEESTSTQCKNTGRPEGAYGYMWWIDQDKNVYKALGWGGQAIYVLPDKNAVVVITSSDYFGSHKIFSDYIFAAFKSSTPLTANPESVNKLETMIKQFASSTGEGKIPIKDHPEIARHINQVTYRLERNPAGWETMAFNLSKGSCQLKLGTGQGIYSLEVGLDNVYRISDMGSYGERPDHNQVAVRGTWKSPDTFFLDFLQIGRPEHAWVSIRFSEKKIYLKIELAGTGGVSFPLKGIQESS